MEKLRLIVCLCILTVMVSCTSNQYAMRMDKAQQDVENVGAASPLDYYQAGIYALEAQMGDEYVHQAYDKLLQRGGRLGLLLAGYLALEAGWEQSYYRPLFQQVYSQLNADNSHLCGQNFVCQTNYRLDQLAAAELRERFDLE